MTEGKQQTCAKRVATEGVSGNPFHVLLGAVALATEGESHTCANCVAAEVVSGNPFPGAIGRGEEIF